MNRSGISPHLKRIFGLIALSLAIFAHSKNTYAQVYQGTEDDFALELGSGIPLSVEKLRLREYLSGVSDYQIGDSWGKKPVLESDLPSRSPAYIRAVLATASFNSATAFYLGRFGQWHVMATNHHVLERSSDCQSRRANFVLLKKRFSCASMIGSWPEIDLALFTISVPESDSKLLQSVGRNFDFKSELMEDTALITAGFGIAGNSNRELMVNDNDDCRVMSNNGEFRLMADPDEYNPASYKAWSFSTGCSVSHGDSGSAMVNKINGAVVGLLWTGAIPKEARIQNSSYLRQLQKEDSDEIWSLLTYAVPATKISEKLKSELQSGRLKNEDKEIVQLILDK